MSGATSVHEPAVDRVDEAVIELYQRSARHYDRLNAVASLGTSNWYRRRTILSLDLEPDARLLDVGCGTGALAIAAQRFLPESPSIVGVDPCPEMRRIAGRGRSRRPGGIPESIPVGDAVRRARQRVRDPLRGRPGRGVRGETGAARGAGDPRDDRPRGRTRGSRRGWSGGSPTSSVRPVAAGTPAISCDTSGTRYAPSSRPSRSSRGCRRPGSTKPSTDPPEDCSGSSARCNRDERRSETNSSIHAKGDRLRPSRAGAAHRRLRDPAVRGRDRRAFGPRAHDGGRRGRHAALGRQDALHRPLPSAEDFLERDRWVAATSTSVTWVTRIVFEDIPRGSHRGVDFIDLRRDENLTRNVIGLPLSPGFSNDLSIFFGRPTFEDAAVVAPPESTIRFAMGTPSIDPASEGRGRPRPRPRTGTVTVVRHPQTQASSRECVGGTLPASSTTGAVVCRVGIDVEGEGPPSSAVDHRGQPPARWTPRWSS